MRKTDEHRGDWKEWRRRRAWELSEQGWKQKEIAEALGVTQGAVVSRLFGTRCMDQGRAVTLEQAGEALDRKKRKGQHVVKKSDAQITQDVLDEIFWDPAVTVADLNVSTHDHRVTLTQTMRELIDAQWAKLAPLLDTAAAA
jgi:transcriptional regulator with XRE-family HTH domain